MRSKKSSKLTFSPAAFVINSLKHFKEQPSAVVWDRKKSSGGKLIFASCMVVQNRFASTYCNLPYLACSGARACTCRGSAPCRVRALSRPSHDSAQAPIPCTSEGNSCVQFWGSYWEGWKTCRIVQWRLRLSLYTTWSRVNDVRAVHSSACQPLSRRSGRVPLAGYRIPTYRYRLMKVDDQLQATRGRW